MTVDKTSGIVLTMEGVEVTGVTKLVKKSTIKTSVFDQFVLYTSTVKKD